MIVGLIIGTFIGSFVGFFVAALINISSDNRDQILDFSYKDEEDYDDE